MPKAYHEALKPMGNLGIKISMGTMKNPYVPMHWHETMEILFCLNGNVTVHAGNEKYLLSRNQIIVFDSKEIHSIQAETDLYMFLCMHVDKKQLSLYCQDLEFYKINCRPTQQDTQKEIEYIKLCKLARELTRSSIQNKATNGLRTDGTALLMLAKLIDHFSVYMPPTTTSKQNQQNEIMRDVVKYVIEHFKEPISLDDVANESGFSKEYFCRFFKKYMGISFLRYLNEVRISQAGRLLITTNMPISEIMIESGFTNQTLFNKLFKEIYGMTPRQARDLQNKKSDS